MLVTNHVLSGALIGLAAPGPVSAFTAGVGSHLVLDAIPHWGNRPMAEILHIAVADGLTGLAVIGVTAAATPRPLLLRVLAGMAGAALLDLDKPSDLFFGRSPFPAWVDSFHARVQRESERRMPQEIVVGLGMAALVGVLLRRH